jgi:vanillate O-demethylase ferredoxin subunit
MMVSVATPDVAASGDQWIPVSVHARIEEAQGVVSLDLRAVQALPAFEAGAHIDLLLPTPQGPLMRQYSLCNDPRETHRYVVGVGFDANGRGGSRWIHESLTVGQTLQVGRPRNHFPLAETAPKNVLIAGGIGVTPLLAMARRLSAIGAPWTLYYCVRTPERAAFLDVLRALPGRVIPVFDGEPGVTGLDIAALARAEAPDTHLYCCGPAPMMQAFGLAVRGRAPDTVHQEWFAAPAGDAAHAPSDGGFDVHLARSGHTVRVPPDRSILEVLSTQGIEVPFACEQGVCGSCETRVLAGRCQHRDLILSEAERDANDRMLICVSRCDGDSLTLDL